MTKLYNHSSFIDLEFRNLYKRIAARSLVGDKGIVGPAGPPGANGINGFSSQVSIFEFHIIPSNYYTIGLPGPPTNPNTTTLHVATFNNPVFILNVYCTAVEPFNFSNPPWSTGLVGFLYLQPTFTGYSPTPPFGTSYRLCNIPLQTGGYAFPAGTRLWPTGETYTRDDSQWKHYWNTNTPPDIEVYNGMLGAWQPVEVPASVDPLYSWATTYVMFCQFQNEGQATEGRIIITIEYVEFPTVG